MITAMAASSITQAGSTISGNSPTLVMIETDQGNLSSSSEGTGTVVAIVCSSRPLSNMSTRVRVQTGDNVLIGGIVVRGTAPKEVLLRASGPSLPMAGALSDPILELHASSGEVIASNDNWIDAPNRQAIIDTTIAPVNDRDSAILISLSPGEYTAVVRGANGATGIAVVEAYDMDQTANSKLANISTRGLVQTGDDVLIGGLMVPGQHPLKVIIRAVGPSLPVAGALLDPTLELRDNHGTVIATNDNWRTDQESEIMATGIAPSNDSESVIVRELEPGDYTAIVRGVNGTVGVAIVEVYGQN